jgi:hypothetical protein
LELPELLSVTLRELLLPTATLLKFKLEALAVSVVVAVDAGLEGATEGVVTVRVAATLVTLPTELLAVTLNRAPLSDVAVAGVV